MPAQSTAHIAPPQDQYLLFWDGECGCCRRAVEWASNRDKTDRLSPFIIDLLRQPPMIWTLEIGYWLVARNRLFFSKILFR